MIHDHIVIVVSVKNLRISFELRIEYVSIELRLLFAIMPMFLHVRVAFQIYIPVQQVSDRLVSWVIKMKLIPVIRVIAVTNNILV